MNRGRATRSARARIRRRRWRAALGTALAVAAVVGGTSFAAGPAVDFPAYMHDAAHSAYSPDATAITPASALAKSWVFHTPAVAGAPARAFISTPIVVDHVIYVGSNTGDFFAIDEATGATLWTDSLGFQGKLTCGNPRGFAATAAAGIDPVSGKLTIYAPSADGNLYALNAADGAIVWTSPVNVPSPGVNDYFNFSSPELANGRIYIGISSFCDNPLVRAGLVSIDQATGAKLKTFFTVPKHRLGGSVWSSPTIAPDGSVVIVTGNAHKGALIGTAQSIVRLDPKSLRKLDSYQLVTAGGDSDFGGSPTVFDATLDGVDTPMVGACNKNGIYYAWRLGDLHDGPVWHDEIGVHGRRADGLICLSGAAWDGAYLYIGGTPVDIGDTFYRGSIRKLDPATGDAVWLTGLPAAVMTTPSLDGAGALAVSSYDGGVGVTNTTFLVDAATGGYTTVDDGDSRAAPSPVFGNDDLLVATGAGDLYSYTTAAPGRR